MIITRNLWISMFLVAAVAVWQVRAQQPPAPAQQPPAAAQQAAVARAGATTRAHLRLQHRAGRNRVPGGPAEPVVTAAEIIRTAIVSATLSLA